MLRTSYTTEQVNFIKENYLKMPVKSIARKLNKSGSGVQGIIDRLGLSVPREIRLQRMLDSRLKKGHTPKNKGKKITEYMSPEAIEKVKKTQFKKGCKPVNIEKVGHERTTKDGYTMIKTSDGLFKQKHTLLWEQKNGKLKEGYCLTCKDGNKKNTSPENWEPILREENMIRNSRHPTPKKLIKTKALICKINNTTKKINDGTK